MTIRGSRTAAAGIGAASAGMDVAFTISAFLLGQPKFLFLVALVMAAQLFAVLNLLSPVSLSTEGGEIIYRARWRQRRLALSEIATCTLVGGSWVFSASSGAQLLTVQILRFKADDIAVFCGQAGISLTAPVDRPVDQRRRDVRSAKNTRAWGVGLGVVLLGGSMLMIYAQFGAQDAMRRYQAAPTCTQAAPTTSTCRLQTSARVTSVERHSTYATLHLTPLTSGGDYLVALDYPNPSTGDVVDVEVWSGKVVLVSGRKSGGNPTLDPNLNLNGLIAIPSLFALICLVGAGIGQYQLVTARAGLRAAAGAEVGSVGPVEKINPDATIPASNLPPCGILHQPKELLYVHEDPRTVTTAIVVTSVVAAVLLAGLVALAVYISPPIFGGIAAVGLVFYSIQLVGQLREIRFGGLFADDLHVGKVATDWLGRFERKVFDRTAVLEVTVETGKISVVGVDGSTLFWTSLLSASEMNRYADFLGVRVVRDVAPAPDGIAVPPVQTRIGVLPLPVRRAAGIMQAIGGLCVGLGLLNLVRIPGTPADRLGGLLLLLGALCVYGGILYVLGLMLARGRPHSRELAVFGGGAATAGFLASWFVATGNPMVVAVMAVLMVPVYLLSLYWLRKPGESRP